jgi:hypothetical protein
MRLTPKLPNVVTSKRDLSASLTTVREARTRIAGWRRSRDKALADAEREAATRFDGLGLDKEHAKYLDKVKTGIRRNFTTEFSPKLAEVGKGLAELRAELPELRAFYGDRRRGLDIATLKSPERAAAMANLTGAGPGAIRSAAVAAIAERDINLAGAIVAVLDRMPTKQRPLDPIEFANEFYTRAAETDPTAAKPGSEGDPARLVEELSHEVELLAGEIAGFNGKSNAAALIAAGLAKQAGLTILDTRVVPDEAPAPVRGKIAAALEASNA